MKIAVLAQNPNLATFCLTFVSSQQNSWWNSLYFEKIWLKFVEQHIPRYLWYDSYKKTVFGIYSFWESKIKVCWTTTHVHEMIYKKSLPMLFLHNIWYLFSNHGTPAAKTDFKECWGLLLVICLDFHGWCCE